MVSVYKSYGEGPVLQDVSLTVQQGEFLVIFGANGAGKTTLLKILSTQARPDSGEVWVGGVERGQDAGAIRRIVGVVAHQNLLYDDLTPHENLQFFGRMYGIKRLKERIATVLSLVGLEGRAHQRVRTLSHGMQKRVALARSVLHDPAILLLDEPESGLDLEALEMLRGLLTVGERGRRTVIMTTHNLEQGLAMGDRVAILSGGRIVYEGDRRDLDEAGFRGTYMQYVGTKL